MTAVMLANRSALAGSLLIHRAMNVPSCPTTRVGMQRADFDRAQFQVQMLVGDLTPAHDRHVQIGPRPEHVFRCAERCEQRLVGVAQRHACMAIGRLICDPPGQHFVELFFGQMHERAAHSGHRRERRALPGARGPSRFEPTAGQGGGTGRPARPDRRDIVPHGSD